MEKTGTHLLISGRVQGVGFRYALQQQARLLGLQGWVRNLVDGRVEAVIAGTPEALDAMLSWCHKGPALARVTQVERLPDTEIPSASDDFEVRPTAHHHA